MPAPITCLADLDLIVEVVSPRTAARDWKNKFDLYEEAGVGEYASPGPIPGQTLPELNLDRADIFAENDVK